MNASEDYGDALEEGAKDVQSRIHKGRKFSKKGGKRHSKRKGRRKGGR
jgi:hypothetical protein